LAEIGYHYLNAPEQTLKVQKISLQLTKIMKASQNVQSVGCLTDLLATLNNMAERGSRDEL
jgi:hypothetical protein